MNVCKLLVRLCSLLILLISCIGGEKNRITSITKNWIDKEIIFPNNLVFTVFGRDTIDYTMSNNGYTIITYVDSVGCIDCKLKLPIWKGLVNEIDSLSEALVPVLFFFHPKDRKDVCAILKRDAFAYPVCIDEEDSLNNLNHFPTEMMLQTFLLDKDNKVVAIGNPIHNPKVKELYLKIILGDKTSKEEEKIYTTVACNNAIINMGQFNWQQEQKAHFILKNVGNSPLVIIDVVTSCGCTLVEYNKEPIRSGKDVVLEVHYKADHPEHFNKTINVYCNTPSSPIKLAIKGNAEQ